MKLRYLHLSAALLSASCTLGPDFKLPDLRRRLEMEGNPGHRRHPPAGRLVAAFQRPRTHPPGRPRARRQQRPRRRQGPRRYRPRAGRRGPRADVSHARSERQRRDFPRLAGRHLPATCPPAFRHRPRIRALPRHLRSRLRSRSLGPQQALVRSIGIAQAAAAEALFDAQRLGLATEVARQYFLLRGLDAQDAVLKDTIKSRQGHARPPAKQSRRRPHRRTLHQPGPHRAGTRQQRPRRSSNASAAPPNTRSPCSAAAARRISPCRRARRQPAMPSIRAGLPAEVLNRRPDVRAAEQDLRAANARIGVAEAAFYPNFSLSAGGGLRVDRREKFPQLGEPRALARRGSRRPDLRRRIQQSATSMPPSARATKRSPIYRNTLLIALREVEDALVDLKGLARSRSALEKALASARDTERIAQERYRQGPEQLSSKSSKPTAPCCACNSCSPRSTPSSASPSPPSPKPSAAAGAGNDRPSAKWRKIGLI